MLYVYFEIIAISIMTKIYMKWIRSFTDRAKRIPLSNTLKQSKSRCEGEGEDTRTIQLSLSPTRRNIINTSIVYIPPGLYKQSIYVSKTKNLITFRGHCAETTVISWSNTATSIQSHHVSSQCKFHLGV